MHDKDYLTTHLADSEELELAKRIIDQAEQALRKHQPQETIFLNPHLRDVVWGVLDNMAEVKFRSFGGYHDAERQRLVIVPDYYLWETLESPVTCLEIRGNFQFQQVSHRDFLGAILGLGIKREMMGDLLVQKDGCQVIVAAEIADAVLFKLKQVHEVPVEVFVIEEEELQAAEARTKEIRSTVPSLRLDAVASSGFSVSRSQMARLIKSQRVKLNWKVEENPAAQVEEGAMISVSGKGRARLAAIEGESRRGRIKILMEKYI
ncbi:MAG: photosystem II S4 domain protein [Halanaerobium sp.]|nr:photosystem II S4 domain protein [Halanaerobium sp.]